MVKGKNGTLKLEAELKEEALASLKEEHEKEFSFGVGGGGLWLEAVPALDQLSRQEAENLEIPFYEVEVHSVLMDMNGDKAPGPDGFAVAFWQNCWDFVKEEVMEMFKEFHEQSSFLKASIPRFWLKKVIGKVVSPYQNAFMMGKQILDASLIANEFFMKVMQKMRFFSSTKGLRQGDPLSPYLFVMGMEMLSALIRRVVEGGFLSGCRIQGRRRPDLNISHLFFVDDTVIFYEAKKENLTHLSWTLFWFEVASRLRINLAKSEIIPVGEMEEVDVMAMELRCRVGSLPSSYLGLLLGAPNKALSVWDGVEERVRRRLALWKRQYISKGRRITLIKSTMASMSIYQRKAYLVNWEVVCADKKKGGLGLRKLVLLNKALFGKWIWRFACDKENLCNLLHVLRGYRLTLEDDSVFWKGGRNGQFGVKEVYSLLVNPNDTTFPKKCIWVDRVPTKVASLLGRLRGGSIEEDEGEDSGAISNAPTTTEDPANFTLVGQTKGAQTVEITNDGGCSIPQDASVVVD
ncbi:hypothetical protein CK203_108285 [Vitis vinifera]|uniref:Reverse transcriptase domain-containing protein n=1 Tax=Vitis vinifera TaxID=29760 RepID=A0A438FFN5_VITVI|nr:hypothetical protein CK203_108285 [Vitis vinifera]